jgi:hypothetical protein
VNLFTRTPPALDAPALLSDWQAVDETIMAAGLRAEDVYHWTYRLPGRCTRRDLALLSEHVRTRPASAPGAGTRPA